MMYMMYCPFPPDITMKCLFEVYNDTAVQITWVNSYPECFNFSVLVDGVAQNDSANETSYTINNLKPNTMYNVCVIAWDGCGTTDINWKDCENITTRPSGMYCM